MFRDYSNPEEATDVSDLDCGLLARLFPRDLFSQISRKDGKVYPITLDNVADQTFLKLFAFKAENPHLQNPLFINWMVSSSEEFHAVQVPEVVGSH